MTQSEPPDKELPGPKMAYFDELLVAAMQATLKDRDRDIFDLRYGITDGEPMTLQEIGEVYGVTRERIRQLLVRCHRRLRAKGIRELKKGNMSDPCAELITHTLSSIAQYGDDQNEAIIEFVEQELPHLPVVTCSIPLVCILVSEKSADIKPRQLELVRLFRARIQARGRKVRKSVERQDILQHVIWPVRQGRWERSRFNDRHAQRSVSSDSRGTAGAFFSSKLQRMVEFESLLEHDFLMRLEESAEVSFYLEQPFKIDYEFDGRVHQYFPDVFFLLKDGRGVVVEVKPVFHMALHRNQVKFAALQEYCASRGMGVMLTDSRRCIQQMLTYPTRPEVEQTILAQLKSGPLNWTRYKTLLSNHHIKRGEFVATVLRHRLQWQLMPFRLSL